MCLDLDFLDADNKTPPSLRPSKTARGSKNGFKIHHDSTGLPSVGLHFGNCLKVLSDHPDDSIDLVYLDPPFNSKRDYNLVHHASDPDSEAQSKAFEDTWQWGEEANKALTKIQAGNNVPLAHAMDSFRHLLGESPTMAYLVMMAPILVEIRRVMKPTASVYLHCDPTASHYLKILMDAVFEGGNFRNEIIWKRTSSHNSAKRWGAIHDVLLYYSKSNLPIWNRIILPFDDVQLSDSYPMKDAKGSFGTSDLTGAGVTKGTSGLPWRKVDPTTKGRHWAVPERGLPEWFQPPEGYLEMSTQERLDVLDNQNLIHWPKNSDGMPCFKKYIKDTHGVPIQDVIHDITAISPTAKERIGYPTQKPLALLERIVLASSNQGDVVLDPFCGSGTTLVAAHKHGRKAIGIDIHHRAIHVIRKRMADLFGSDFANAIHVHGDPTDIAGIRELTPYDFEDWVRFQLGANPYVNRRGNDKGIDGVIYMEVDGKQHTVPISIKSGEHVNPEMVQALKGVMDQLLLKDYGGDIGVLVLAYPPTVGMKRTALSYGYYQPKGIGNTGDDPIPKIQIITAGEILAGQRPKLPAMAFNTTFKATVDN